MSTIASALGITLSEVVTISSRALPASDSICMTERSDQRKFCLNTTCPSTWPRFVTLLSTVPQSGQIVGWMKTRYATRSSLAEPSLSRHSWSLSRAIHRLRGCPRLRKNCPIWIVHRGRELPLFAFERWGIIFHHNWVEPDHAPDKYARHEQKCKNVHDWSLGGGSDILSVPSCRQVLGFRPNASTWAW